MIVYHRLSTLQRVKRPYTASPSSTVPDGNENGNDFLVVRGDHVLREVCFLALDEDASGHLHRDAFLRFADGLGGPRAGWATANAA